MSVDYTPQATPWPVLERYLENGEEPPEWGDEGSLIFLAEHTDDIFRGYEELVEVMGCLEDNEFPGKQELFAFAQYFVQEALADQSDLPGDELTEYCIEVAYKPETLKKLVELAEKVDLSQFMNAVESLPEDERYFELEPAEARDYLGAYIDLIKQASQKGWAFFLHVG